MVNHETRTKVKQQNQVIILHKINNKTVTNGKQKGKAIIKLVASRRGA